MTDIKDIQTTLAFHEKTIQELSDVITTQWAEIEKLKRQLGKASDRIADLESGSDAPDQSNVKPPHY
jgi:SlyX protein